MSIDPNGIINVETQPQTEILHRLVLSSQDTIPGQVDHLDTGTAQPNGIMVKGPFGNSSLIVNAIELNGITSSVIMQATYNLDYAEITLTDKNDPSQMPPTRTGVNAGTTWETVHTFALSKLGSLTTLIDWATAGLSKDVAPTALRFLFSDYTTMGRQARITVEEVSI